MKHKYTDQQFINAVKKSYNIRQVCLKLGIVAYGGNYYVIKRKIAKMQIDTSHFGKTPTKRITCKSLPLDVILTQGSYYNNLHSLKEMLLKNKIFEYKCYKCGKSTVEINGQILPIPLQLHHIDGDRDNNDIKNLTLLCPICHSLTTNFRGRNKVKKQYIVCEDCGKQIRKNKYGLCKDCYVKKNYSETNLKTHQKTYCQQCGVELTCKSKSGLCRACFNKTMTNPNKPTKQILQEQVKNNSMLSLGRKYGVSDASIRKWCRQYGIDYKHGIRKESLQGLKKGRLTQSQRSKLKRICPICGREKASDSEMCKTCWLKLQLRKKQEYYKQISENIFS